MGGFTLLEKINYTALVSRFIRLKLKKKMIQYKPLLNRLVIKPLPKKEKTESGIIIPNEVTAKELLSEGTVLITGDKLEQTKEGDHVLYSAAAGGEVSINGEPCVLLFETDVWMIYRDDKK